MNNSYKVYFYKTIKCILLYFIVIIPVIYIITGILKPNGDVYEAITASQKQTTYSSVLLGDSVSRQLFNIGNQENSQYYHLNSNQAIGVIGNYILLNNYLANNPQTKKVYLIMRPTSFNNNLNQKWTYTYFILPFLKKENKKYFSETSLKKINIKRKFLNKYLLNIFEPNPKLSLLLKIDYSDEMTDIKEAYLSDVSIEYLKKIKKLLQEKNIEFYILASPLSIKEKNEYILLKRNIKENYFEDIFVYYFDSIQYYSENNFSDGVHFSKKFLENNREKIIDNLFRY
ncbi:hypothetical protein FV113G1_09730 [Fusobacterium varium]|nr:hypothetical protein FV113G1_09730 [Fusobacterium varium]